MDFSLGECIKKARKDKKLTQIELAKLIDKTESSMRKYENGKVIPPLNVVYKICRVLEINDVDLLGVKNFTQYSSNMDKNEQKDFYENELAALVKKIDPAIIGILAVFEMNGSNKEVVSIIAQRKIGENHYYGHRINTKGIEPAQVVINLLEDIRRYE